MMLVVVVMMVMLVLVVVVMLVVLLVVKRQKCVLSVLYWCVPFLFHGFLDTDCLSALVSGWWLDVLMTCTWRPAGVCNRRWQQPIRLLRMARGPMAWYDRSDQQPGRKDRDEETQRPTELGWWWTRSGERETDEPPPFLCYAGLQVVRF